MRWKLRNYLPSNSLGLARRPSSPKRSSVQPVQRVSKDLKERLLNLLREVKEDLGSQGVLKLDESTGYDFNAPDEFGRNPWRHVQLASKQSTLFVPFRPAKRPLGPSPRRRDGIQRSEIRRRHWYARCVRNQRGQIIRWDARSRNKEYPLKLPGRKLLMRRRRKRFMLQRRNQGIEVEQKPATQAYLHLTPTVQQALRITWGPLGEQLYYFNRARLWVHKGNIATGLQALAEKIEQLSQTRNKDLGTATSSNFAAGEIQASTSSDKRWEVPAQGLPLSPLLNPNLTAARERRRSPKPPSSKEVSEYERKLVKCPYAQALATPVRLCYLTGIRLPNFFYIGFGLTRHQETSAPWYLTLGLSDVASDSGRHDDDKSDEGEDEGLDSPKRPRTIYPRPIGAGSGTFITAQGSALQHICALKPKEFTRIIPARWKENSIKPNEIVWRKDMDLFVLGLLRRKVVKCLLRLCSRKGGFLVERPTFAMDRVLGKQVGAVMWLGKPISTQNTENEEFTQSSGAQSRASHSLASQSQSSHNDATTSEYEEGSAIEQNPPPYTMALYRGRYLPVYNLKELLGDEHCQQLRQHGCPFTQEVMVIKSKPNTVTTQNWLWKLMGYLAGNEPGR